jgi:hypothetical protein
MNDPLKKYIRAHREDFDSEVPDPALWDRLSQRIATNPAAPSLRSFRRGLLAAAAVVVAISLPLILHTRSDRPQTVASIDTAGALYDQELYHFTQIVNIKFREIERIKGAHPELYQRFSADLQKLDTAYRQLKDELPNQPNQEVLLQAMLQNLTLQIDLINRQLGIIEQLKNDSHARTTTHI